MTEELKNAVAGLHHAFANEPRPTKVIGCTNCCIDETQLARLVEIPREQLTAEELSAYSSNVPDTVGTEADFKYFLPRIFELVAGGELQRIGAGWEIRRLKYTAWTSSPPEQVQAIRAYLMAWWLEALSEKGTGEDEHLVYIGEIEPVTEFRRYLDVWLQAGKPALLQLAEFILENITQLALGRKWDAFATDESVTAHYRWLCSGPPARALEQAHDDDPSAPEALILIEAAALVTL